MVRCGAKDTTARLARMIVFGYHTAHKSMHVDPKIRKLTPAPRPSIYVIMARMKHTRHIFGVVADGIIVLLLTLWWMCRMWGSLFHGRGMTRGYGGGAGGCDGVVGSCGAAAAAAA